MKAVLVCVLLAMCLALVEGMDSPKAQLRRSATMMTKLVKKSDQLAPSPPGAPVKKLAQYDDVLNVPAHLNKLTELAKDKLTEMNRNFQYHDRRHAETVARGAYKMTLELLGVKGMDAALVAYTIGLLHDVGYQLATVANTYHLLSSSDYDWRANFREQGKLKPNAKHEEYSLLVALQNIEKLFTDDRNALLRRHITADIVGWFWAGILVTKMGKVGKDGPARSEDAWEKLVDGKPTLDGFDPNQTGFSDVMTNLYRSLPGLEKDLKGKYLQTFKAAVKLKTLGAKKNPMIGVVIAMRAADFWYTVQPNSICISENCRLEFNTYGGNAIMAFDPVADIYDPLELVKLFYKGQKFFVEKIVWVENPILQEEGRNTVGNENMLAVDAVQACVEKLTKENWHTEYPKCFTPYCHLDHNRVRLMRPPSLKDETSFDDDWAKYYGFFWVPK